MEVRSFAVRQRELQRESAERERELRGLPDKKMNRGSCGDHWGALRLSRTLCGTGEGECPRDRVSCLSLRLAGFSAHRAGRARLRRVLRVIYYANASGAEPAI